MAKKRSRLGWAALALLLVAFAFETSAQDETSAANETDSALEASEPSRAAPNVDEITVTGVQSDVTSIQNESQAVTAFSMEDLDRSNIVSTEQLAFNVPALHVGQTGSGSIITLRGIGTENSSITGEPGLQFHVDGVNFSRPAAARVAFFDLEGLQVKRGPQGFDGGKNATAGHIEVSTRKPGPEFETQLDYQWGSYDKQRVRGAINIPLNEYVQTRFAFFRDDRSGYQKNLLPVLKDFETLGRYLNTKDYRAFDADDLGWRAHIKLLNDTGLSFLPTELLLTHNYYEQKGVGPATELQQLPLHEECTDPPFGPGRVTTYFPNFAVCGLDVRQGGIFGGPLVAKPALDNGTSTKEHVLYRDRLSRQENIYWGWTAKADWDFDGLPLLGETQLKSITSFQSLEIFQDGDRDATDLERFYGNVDNGSESWLQELQWTGSPSELVDFKLSLFYSRETGASLIDIISFNDERTLRVNIEQEIENKSYGLALNTDWNLRDDLVLTLGGRWVKDQKKTQLLRDNTGLTADAFGAAFNVCTGGADGDFIGGVLTPTDPVPTCEQRHRHLTGIAKLQWWATEENQIYISAASGFKSGGFSALEFGPYQPEYIWSYELGSKNTFFDERLTLNFAGYYYHYRNLQLVVTDGPSTLTQNGDAVIKGLELEYNMELLPGLRINGQGTYTLSEFSDYEAYDPIDSINAFNCRQNDSGVTIANPGECVRVDWSGNELSRAPKLSVTLGVEYDLFFETLGTLTPRIQYYWQDDTWYRAFNREIDNSGPNCGAVGLPSGPNDTLCGASLINDKQDSYLMLDAKVTWRSPNETYYVEAGAQNLTDNRVYQNVLIGASVLGNPGFAWYGAPRTYTFTLGMRF